jgi:DNA-binding MarR family transcriptional regulator
MDVDDGPSMAAEPAVPFDEPSVSTDVRSADASATGIGSTDPALELEEFLPYRLSVLANLTAQALSRVYAGTAHISGPEWRILVTLGQFGVMTGKTVGQHSQMHKTKVSRAVAILEERKLVARKTNRSDLRESLLSLTPSGRALYAELLPDALAFAAELEQVIDPADRAAFERTLTRLTEQARLLAAETAGRKPPE